MKNRRYLKLKIPFSVIPHKIGLSLCVKLSVRKRCASSAHDLPRKVRKNAMKAKSKVENDEMRSECKFDYASAVRGKCYLRPLKEGANIVVLEPDVAKAFRSSAAVNEALRSLLNMSVATRRLMKHVAGRG